MAEKRVRTHQLAKHDRLFKDVHRVVDTERVQHCGQQHVFTDEGELTVSLHEWLRVLQILIDFAEQEYLDQGVAEHHNLERGHGDNEGPHLTLNKHDQEASIEECVQSCNLTHEQFYHVPAIKLKDCLVIGLNRLLDQLDCYEFVETCT